MSVPTDPPHTPGQIFPVCLGASNKGTTGASGHPSQQPSAPKRSRSRMDMQEYVDCSSDADREDGSVLQSSNIGIHLKDVPSASLSQSGDIHRPCGLSSGGRPNQCYVNASIQALLAVPQFRSGLSSIDTAQGVAKRLLMQLRAVIRNTKGGRVFSPTVPRFPGDKQEDAWEYIASILGKIPRCSHVFHGLHKITSVCTKYKCSGKSVQENVPLPGYVLNVDILANGNLRDALLTFKYQSGQDGDPNVTFAKCPGCESTDAKMTRRFEMSALPSALIIKANRFQQDEFGNRTKNNLRLTCPARLHEKDISNISCSQQQVSYELVAIVSHHGESFENGHYTAFVRYQPPNPHAAMSWYACNDEDVKKVTQKTVLEDGHGYLFFYSWRADQPRREIF